MPELRHQYPRWRSTSLHLGAHASPDIVMRADVNGDGNVTTLDINVLINLILA